MFVFLVLLATGFAPQSDCAVLEGEPEILNNGTVFDTEDGDIAHITCMSRGEPRSLVRWEKEGHAVKDKDEGIAVLSRNNGSLQESHLFVAVTSSDRRGEYVCVVTNENGVAKQSFRIKDNSGKLSTLDISAICISVGISVFFVLAIGIFLWRGARKVKLSKKRQRTRTISQSSAHENGALIGDNTDTTPTKESRNGIKNESRKSKTAVTTV